MKEILHTFRKKWKYIAGITAVLAVAFSICLLYQDKMKSKAADGDEDTYIFLNEAGSTIQNGGTFTIRRRTEQFRVRMGSGAAVSGKVTWSIMGSNGPVSFYHTGSTAPTSVTGPDVRLQVDSIGVATILCDIDTNGDNVTDISLMMVVDAVFSINENLSNDSLSTANHVAMNYIYPGDERKAIIMDCGATLQIGNDNTLSSELKLIYGNATDGVWSTSNTDVFSIGEKTGDGTNAKIPIVATGVGVATLSVTYQDPGDLTRTYSDSLQVYVRPKISKKEKDPDGNETGNWEDIAGGIGTVSNTATVNNGDVLRISVLSAQHPEISLSDKMVWVISKGRGDDEVLVRDSLGNKGNGADDAKLTPYEDAASGVRGYRVDAKAGNYNLYFYVKGTYTTFKGKSSNTCTSVNLSLAVNCNFGDKNETVELGGFYSLSEALNIPLDVLQEYFTVRWVTDSTGNPVGGGDNYIDLRTGKDDLWRAYANKGQLGTATFEVEFNQSSTITIPGMPAPNAAGHRVATITLVISDTFTLNMTNLTMAIGSKQTLTGVIGSGAYAEASQFTWSVSNVRYVTLDKYDSQQVEVTALQETPTNQPVIVSLEWQDSHGVTHVATCSIIVTTSAANFEITPKTLKLEVGASEYLNTTLSGTQDITWLSSDVNLVTVEAQAGNVAAKVTATANVGSAVITAYNKANDSYATCVVTVVASVTSLSIDKGESFTTSVASGFVFMNAVYQPANATETEMEWTSSNNAVATVDNMGTVTILKKGQTTITVKPVYNPNGLFAQCVLSVVEVPIRSITTNVDNLNMVKGSSEQLLISYQPVNATETGITCSSLDQKVATVSPDGVITAVGVGTTNIIVSANVAYDTESNPNQFAQSVITVNVRNRLESIKFESNPMYVAQNRTQQVNVIFTPSTDINKNLTYKSSNEEIFKVSDEGVLTGVTVGQAMLSVIAEDLGEGGIITCMVYVLEEPVYATDFMIVPETQTLEAGTEFQMSVEFTPTETTERDLVWTSSDTNIAEVDSNGLVTAKEVGNTILTAVYNDAPDGVPIIRNCNLQVTPPAVHATDFDITPLTQNLVVGEKFTITPVFTPEDTTNKNVEYQSTDEEVVTVDENGVVTAVGAGDTIVSCQSEDTSTVATCSVHVDNAIKFSLSPSKREIALGKSFTLKKVTVPANATKTATWTSSNTKIATVNKNGKVTGKKLGSCTITCTLTRYHQSAKCRVTVAKLKTKIKFDKTSIRIGLGQTYRLKATVTTNNSSTPKISWKTSNKRVVTVNSSGKLKAKKIGIARITATTKDAIKAKATCKVRVIRRATSIKISPGYMVCYIGKARRVKATVRPSNATIKSVKYSSSNTDIATVSGNGSVIGISEGDVYITAQTTDGSNKRARCFVKVLEAVPATDVVVAQTDMTMKKGDKATISYTVLPNDTSDTLKFASDNKRVAKVNKKGRISAVGTGNAKITILTTSGVSTEVNVNVVALNKSTLRMRQYDTETLVVHGTSDRITWYSSNARVATVTNGRIVGRGKGTATIYAYVNGCRLGCRVTVTSVNAKRQ